MIPPVHLSVAVPRNRSGTSPVFRTKCWTPLPSRTTSISIWSTGPRVTYSLLPSETVSSFGLLTPPRFLSSSFPRPFVLISCQVVKLNDFSLPESDSLPGGSVTSVCWMNGGTHIAVGTSCGRIQVWDATKGAKVRELHPHSGRVGSLSWNQQYCLLASGWLPGSRLFTHISSFAGSKDKSIFLQDSRIRGAFTPSRHLSPSQEPPAYPTPQRPSHPLHSDSPDHRPHYPILSSRPISAHPSPHTYSSPQRLLSSMHEKDEELEGKSAEEEDSFGRYLGNSPSGRSVRRRQTLSPSSSYRSSGIPPRPPSLPGTADNSMFHRVSKSTDLQSSRSVFGSEDMEMEEVSDDEEGDFNPLRSGRKVVVVAGSQGSGQRTRDSSVRKLDFVGNREVEEGPLDLHFDDRDSSPPSPVPFPSCSPPTTLADFLSRPTYSPQYASPNSHSVISPSDHFSDLNEDSSSTSSPSLVHELCCHKQEVCGLRWSFDDKQLASGGNDNKLFIWNISGMSFNERSQQRRDASGSHRNQIFTPEHQFDDHTAAVKAIAWSPHQHGLLVSGGGTADRHMRFWNTQTGTALQALDTGSQVTPCLLLFP